MIQPHYGSLQEFYYYHANIDNRGCEAPLNLFKMKGILIPQDGKVALVEAAEKAGVNLVPKPQTKVPNKLYYKVEANNFVQQQLFLLGMYYALLQIRGEQNMTQHQKQTLFDDLGS